MQKTKLPKNIQNKLEELVERKVLLEFLETEIKKTRDAFLQEVEKMKVKYSQSKNPNEKSLLTKRAKNLYSKYKQDIYNLVNLPAK
jgi:recombinational DNA repair ATPase RecF